MLTLIDAVGATAAPPGLMSLTAPLLVALRGMPGIGKTALARAVGRELGWPVLDKDDIKEVVYRRTPVADELSYDLLFRLAQRQLRQGLNVVVDNPLMNAGLYALASRTAVEADATLVVLDCMLSDAAEHLRRIEARAADRPKRRGDRTSARWHSLYIGSRQQWVPAVSSSDSEPGSLF